MIYSDPYFRRRAFEAALLGPAIYAASITEGSLLVNTPYTFLKLTIGAHSVAVFATLLFGYVEIADSIRSKCFSLKSNWIHLLAFGFILGGTIIHILSLVNLHLRRSPYDRKDPALRSYLNFCRVFVFTNFAIEYFIYNLLSARVERLDRRKPLTLVL